jgi:TolB-like protein/tetratricopeptide (TPR) repeat protein
MATFVAPQIFRFGPFQLDAQSGELRKHGLRIRLQEQPLQILLLLLERAGEVVGREELRCRLWPEDTFVDVDVGVNSAIKRLRDALGDSAENPRYVETFRRHGYRFIGAVQPPSLPRIRSIAVLPFENFTGNRAQDYLVDGMTDGLIADLAQIIGLRVISRTSVMVYKGAKKSLAEVARELNVDAVVEGAVARSGKRLRITAQLIHVPTDRHLWARSYECDPVTIRALQGEIASAIAQGIKVELAPHERTRLTTAPLVNTKAYDTYLKARYHFHKQTAVGYFKAIKMFERAIAEEPAYALAYTGLSECYRLLTFWGPLSPQESAPKAEAAAQRALELDDALAEAHAQLAVIAYRFHHDWSRGEREFRRALELSPNHAECHLMYSVFLWSAGRFDDALSEAQRGQELDPLSGSTNAGVTFLWSRQYDRAIAEYRRALQIDPKFPHAHFGLGSAYTLRGDFDEEIRELQVAVRLSRRNPTYLSRMGHDCAVAGKKGEARKVLEELQARSRQEYVSPVGIALVHLGLGDREEALNWLEKAYHVRDFDLVTRNPRLDSLRSDPRYQHLLRRIGLSR